jgi:hypothetical protein
MTEQVIDDVMRNAQVWSNTGKNYASIVGNVFADYPMTNIYFFEPLFFSHIVPLSNPANTLILLCICSANLKSEGQFWQESRKSFKFGFWQTLLAEF